MELLLEHQSTPVVAFVERMAFALRNDFSVSTRAAPKVPFASGFGRVIGATLLITSVETDPVFLRSFRGLVVDRPPKLSRSASPAPCARTMNTTSSSGKAPRPVPSRAACVTARSISRSCGRTVPRGIAG